MDIKNVRGLMSIDAQTVFLAVFAVGAVVLFATGTAGAQKTISSCQEINATNDGGGLVELGGDISATGDCIEINTSDVVFDGLGNTITGPGSSGIGIEANATSAGGGATNVTVRDVKVEDFEKGIQYDSNGLSAGGEITNVNVTGNSQGLFAISAGGVPVDVTNSELVYNGDGAQAYFTGRFEGNEISNNTANGLNLLSTTQVVNNDIKNNGGRGIQVDGANIRVADNEIVNNSETGVYVKDNGAVIENNLVTDNNQGSGQAGIWVDGASDVRITNNNRVHRNRLYGVYADDASGLVIRNSRITENCGGNTGLRVSGTSSDVLIESSNVSNNTGYGIRYFASGSNATIRDVEANDNGGVGVSVTSTPSPTLTNIEANDNLFAGAAIGPSSSDADLDDITAVGNGDTGVEIRGDGTVITNSEVRDNGFGVAAGPAPSTGINVNAVDVAVRNTVTESNDMDIRSDKNTTLENVDLGSATVSGTATEVEINGTPVSAPADPSGVQSTGTYFEATNTAADGFFDATVDYGAGGSASLWKYDGSWNELGGTGGAGEVSYNITSFSTFGVFADTGGSNTPPNAEYDVDEPLTAGEQATFDATASTDPDGRIVSYRWEVYGPTQSNYDGETMTHTFAEEGEYDVYLKVDDGSAIDTVTKSVTVQEETDEQTTDGGTSETDTDDGTEDSEEESTGGDGDGSGEEDSEEPSGFDLPSEASEVGDELTLEAGDVGLEGNVTEYEWTVDGEVVGTERVVSHILESSGDVNVTLSVTDDTGNNATFTRTLSVAQVQEETEERQEQMGQMEQNETEDETDETEEGTNESDNEQGGEGLPGFTAVAALLAALVVIARRRV